MKYFSDSIPEKEKTLAKVIMDVGRKWDKADKPRWYINNNRGVDMWMTIIEDEETGEKWPLIQQGSHSSVKAGTRVLQDLEREHGEQILADGVSIFS